MIIHPALRDVFGERQPLSVVVTVLAAGTAATAGLVLLDPDVFSAVPWWRAVLAVVLIWDIACGCLANVTRSTNDYYAERATHRRVFLAVHVHLVLVALLLSAPLVPVLAIWAFTIAAATVVNRLTGSPHQLFVAVTALAAALIVVPFLPDLGSLMTSVSLLFVTKVVLAFGVDHTGGELRR